jgi:hypothetical protein
MELVKRQVNPEMVKKLSELLEMAKSGELNAVHILYDTIGSNDGDSFSTGSWSVPNALYAFECWKHKLLHTVQREDIFTDG